MRRRHAILDLDFLKRVMAPAGLIWLSCSRTSRLCQQASQGIAVSGGSGHLVRASHDRSLQVSDCLGDGAEMSDVALHRTRPLEMRTQPPA
jgi:hypothetical protein